MVAETGMVRIHAQAIRSTIVHFSALNRLAAPTPMMAADTLCVVDTGMPKCDATPMIAAEVVPAAITSAHITLIQIAIVRLCPGSGGAICRKESQCGKLTS